MAVDNTHTKYLKGNDKKAWNNYGESIKATAKLESFINGFGKLPKLKAGEEYDIPVKKNKNKKTK